MNRAIDESAPHHDMTPRHAPSQADSPWDLLLAVERELALAQERLRAQTTIDDLTGLKNMRAFHERLNEEWERFVRARMPLSLILLDVDQLKAFNQQHGREAGDHALRTLAEILREHTRPYDTVARYASEELAIIAPETDGAAALAVAERLRRAIADHPWTAGRITASFGVATALRSMPDPGSLIEDAQLALHYAKRHGNNSVVHYRDASAAEG